MAQARENFEQAVELYETPVLYIDINYSETKGTIWYEDEHVQKLVMERDPRGAWVITRIHQDDGSFERIGKNIRLAEDARKPIVAKTGYAAARAAVGGFAKKIFDRRI